MTDHGAQIGLVLARLAALGATQVSAAPCSEHGSTWVLITDPEGNAFCVRAGGQPG